MKAFVIAIVLLCCILMFFVKRKYKIGILISGTILFTIVNVPVLPFHGANQLLPLAFILSELKQIKNLIRSSRNTIVWKLCGLSVFMMLLTIIFSPHLSDFSSIRYFVQAELFFKYFAILYAFWGFSDAESIKPTLRMTLVAMVVITCLGVVNYLTKSADYVSAMMAGVENTGIGASGDEAGQVFMERERFRVQAMFLNPFDYGYICVLVLLLHIYGYINKLESKWNFILVLACSVFGIVSCGCRTNIFCALVGVSIFSLFAYKLGKTIRLALIMLLVAIAAYQFVPSIQEVVDNMMTMFDKNSDVGGSSMELRALQYGAVLYHIQNNPLFGCGYNYFLIDMGWGLGKEYLMDQRLAGLEGVAMNYSLEIGCVGFFLYLVYDITVIVFFLKNRKYAMHTVALGLGVVGTYLSFANMTGELLSVYPTLLLLGYVFKVIDYNRLRNTITGGGSLVINYILAHTLCRNFKTARVWA